MDLETLFSISQMKIYRSEQTERLYQLEERAMKAIRDASSELASVYSEGELTEEDVLALELHSLLETFGGAGASAARIIVKRYGAEPTERFG